MENLKEILVVLKKPDGETVVIREPDYVTYPDASQPYWTVVKDKTEIRTSGEVWVEKALVGNEVICEDSVVCTGTKCFHRLPHPRSEECGKSCEVDRAANCRPYRI
ncbi:MAG TPA: hypothetical protein VFG09_09220 [Thermodesulfovibrionales bacterium]|nr:hypothetical protein [Thermodesulfovibrionales bacterium]